MRISKTRFKNMTRCNNFAALLDMYQNRMAHHVKDINGIEQTLTIDQLSKLPSDLFNEETEEAMEIFHQMFDEDTGADLTNVTSQQLEAFQEIFTRVEQLAATYISKVFDHDIVASINTYAQKKYSYQSGEHQYYCYLDAYFEENNTIRIFEVKATTSQKYDDYGLTIRKIKTKEGCKLPFFRMNQNQIIDFIGNQYIGQTINDKKITAEMLQDQMQKLLYRYGKEGKYIYDLAVERHIIEQSYLTKAQEMPNIE